MNVLLIVCLSVLLGTSWCMERRRWRGLCGYICGTLWIHYKNERQPYRWYIIHNNKEGGRICLVASEIISNEFTFHERWNGESNDRVSALQELCLCVHMHLWCWVLLGFIDWLLTWLLLYFRSTTDSQWWKWCPNVVWKGVKMLCRMVSYI